jgi:8-oxo-dGTP diphosphatase
MCECCGVTLYNNPVPSACGVLLSDDYILLVRRKKPPYLGGWELPGGFCESGEHPETAVKREILEETKIRVGVRGLVGIWMDTYPTEDIRDPLKSTLNITYLLISLDAVSYDTQESSEECDSAWWPMRSIPSNIAFPNSTAPAIRAGIEMSQASTCKDEEYH